MIGEIKTHPVAYIILVTLLTLFVVAFLAAWPNHALQRMVAVGMGATYMIWGLLTHLKTSHVTRRVVVEYVVVGLLASLLLVLVTV
jgi:hypothetical protein